MKNDFHVAFLEEHDVLMFSHTTTIHTVLRYHVVDQGLGINTYSLGELEESSANYLVGHLPSLSK